MSYPGMSGLKMRQCAVRQHGMRADVLAIRDHAQSFGKDVAVRPRKASTLSTKPILKALAAAQCSIFRAAQFRCSGLGDCSIIGYVRYRT
jgi:hypothetical protein